MINSREIIRLILLIYILFLIIYQLPFFKSSSYISGWDTVSHEYTLEKYTNSVSKLNPFFYDDNWFNGYPAFIFYPPFFFILVNFIYLFFLKIVPLIFIFKFIILLSTVFFVFALYLFFRNYFNYTKNKSIIFSIFVSFFFLFSPKWMDQFGIGFSSIYGLGEITNFVGIVIGLFLVAFASKFFRNTHRKLKDYIILILLLTSLFLTHIFSIFIFSLFFGFIFIERLFKTNFKEIKKDIFSFLIILLCSLILSSFWLIPFLSNLFFSSAQVTQGINGFNLNVFFLLIRKNYIMIICFIIALFGIKKSKSSLNSIVLILYLAINSVFYSFGLSLHYYRFAAFIYLFYLIFLILGFYFLYSYNFKFKKYIKILVIILFIFIITLNFYYIVKGYVGLTNEYKFTIDNYPSNDHYKEFISYLKKLDIKNIYVEQNMCKAINCFSSPHMLETVIAKENIGSLLGLYTESSYSVRYFFKTILNISLNQNWLIPQSKEVRINFISDINNNLNSEVSNTESKKINKIKQNNLSLDFNKLINIFNVNYILANSYKLNNNLQQINLIPIKKFDFNCDENYTLYKLSNNIKEVQVLDKLPFVYFGKLKEWRDFSEIQYNSELYNYPIIRSNRKISDFDFSNFSDKYSGIILSKKYYNKINNLDISNISIITYDINDSLSLFFDNKLIKSKYEFKNLFKKNKHYNEANINMINISKNNINFNLDSNYTVPVIIKKTYFPYWKASNKDGIIEVYNISPTNMLVYTDSNTKFYFSIPIYIKILFLVTILFYILSIIYFIFYKKRKIINN